MYPRTEPRPDLPALEREVIESWDRDRTFRASVDCRADAPEMVFYDGPPFANGLPHYGHILTGFVKDAVPRYETMRGRRVERRFGWDCHGLPVEMEAQRELGLRGRADVLDRGIATFTTHCASSVQRYTDEWRFYVSRQARWVDFDGGYRTMDLGYMESVLWAFKRLWDSGLVYEGLRVLPYCWECETPLSNFETRLDDAYRDREDPALTVAFDLEPEPGDPGRLRMLVWTTTPWTLPSNLALAVDPNADYALWQRGEEVLVLAAARAAAYETELQNARHIGTVRGAQLAGRRYRPLFGYFEDTANAFRVIASDFVDPEDGTGVVHLAPGFGEDDQTLCEANGIGVVCPVDAQCRFTAQVPDFAGAHVLEASPAVTAALQGRGAVVREDRIVHAYPHCWRTDTPLVYRAVGSWFVRVTALRDRMLELNQQIRWVPGHVRDGSFGRWLEGVRDWSISRNRFWGAPIPVWRSDDPRYPRVDVYGSLDELERDFGVRPADLHRPAIDELVRPNPDDPTGRSMMRRVTDVLDCWFESGCMPFAQVHYPFENREWLEEHFPADFIVEYVGQTRGWFYTLHVLATALFDRPAFRSSLVHGVLLGSDGRKLSKRLGNYPDPLEVFERHGADAMRWFLLSSQVLRGQDLVVAEDGVAQAARRVLQPLWSSWHFFSTYARADGVQARRRTDAAGVLDRWILARTRALVQDVTARMDALDLAGACGDVEVFLDALNNWYVRRSRARFWRPGADEDKADAYDTLYTVLETLLRVMAPLAPLVAERVFTDLTAQQSVHLADWPETDDLPADEALVGSMERVREVCSAALGLRRAHDLRTRLPLRALVVAVPDPHVLEPFAGLVADEVNVKEVVVCADVEAHASSEFRVVPAVAGPRLGADVQRALAAARCGDWTLHDDGTAEAGGVRLQPGEFTHSIVAADPSRSRVLSGGGVVVLDVAVTPDLQAEGLARDVVRLVQVARREAGFEITDRIVLTVDAPDGVIAAVKTHAETVARETLAEHLVLGPVPAGATTARLPDRRVVRLHVQRAGGG